MSENVLKIVTQVGLYNDFNKKRVKKDMDLLQSAFVSM